jgi:hypothetical protein
VEVNPGPILADLGRQVFEPTGSGSGSLCLLPGF